MSKPWDMARVASRRELPKPRKMLGPVGARLETNGSRGVTTKNREWFGESELTACKGCGCHECGCRVPVKHPPVVPPTAGEGLPQPKNCEHSKRSCSVCKWVNGVSSSVWERQLAQPRVDVSRSDTVLPEQLYAAIQAEFSGCVWDRGILDELRRSTDEEIARAILGESR